MMHCHINWHQVTKYPILPLCGDFILSLVESQDLIF